MTAFTLTQLHLQLQSQATIVITTTIATTITIMIRILGSFYSLSISSLLCYVCSGICRKPNAEKTKTAKGGTWESPTLEKETKTIYDMVAHLSGKPVPAINPGNPLPSDPKERVHQIHYQHKILLTFVR